MRVKKLHGMGNHLAIDGIKCEENKLRDQKLIYHMLDNLPRKIGLKKMIKPKVVYYEAKNKSEEVEPWDNMNIIDYRKVVTYGKNWSELFEKTYTKPGEEKIRGGKEEKTKWMQKLERIRNENFHSYSVKEDEYNFLCDLTEWLIEKK